MGKHSMKEWALLHSLWLVYPEQEQAPKPFIYLKKSDIPGTTLGGRDAEAMLKTDELLVLAVFIT